MGRIPECFAGSRPAITNAPQLIEILAELNRARAGNGVLFRPQRRSEDIKH